MSLYPSLSDDEADFVLIDNDVPLEETRSPREGSTPTEKPVNELDAPALLAKIKNHLTAYNISHKDFGKCVLGLNELATSYLFSSSKSFSSLTPKQRALCEKMRRWMNLRESGEGVRKTMEELDARILLESVKHRLNEYRISHKNFGHHVLGLNEHDSSYLFTSPGALTAFTPNQRKLCEKMHQWMEEGEEGVNALMDKVQKQRYIEIAMSASQRERSLLLTTEGKKEEAMGLEKIVKEKEDTIQSLTKEKEDNDQALLGLKKKLFALTQSNYQYSAHNEGLRNLTKSLEERNQNLNDQIELNDKAILDLTKELLAAEHSREDQLWVKNEELDQMKMAMEVMQERYRIKNRVLEEEISALKEMLLEKMTAECEPDNQLRMKNDELHQLKMELELKEKEHQSMIEEIEGRDEVIFSLEKLLVEANHDRENQLWMKNEELQQMKMGMVVKDEEMLNLKKQLMEAEHSREDQLWMKNEEIMQIKMDKQEIEQLMCKEVAAREESKVKQLLRESDHAREEQLWVKNGELMEMRMNVEIKDQQIKELQDEVEKMRRGETNQSQDKEVNVENAQFEATKNANRAAFAKYYRNIMKHTFEGNSNQDFILTCLLLNVLLPILCLCPYVPHAMNFDLHIISILCLIPICVIDKDADSTRILAYFGSVGASIYMPFSSQNQFYPLLLLKFFLAIIYVWILKNDEIQTSHRIRHLLERASGLDICSDERSSDVTQTEEDDTENDTSTTTSSSAPTAQTATPSIPRTVILTKKLNEELGLVVQICPESESFFVKYVIPRGLSECPEGISIGDEILTVNGVSLKGASIEFAKSVVRSVEGPIRVEVRNTSNQGYSESEYSYYL